MPRRTYACSWYLLGAVAVVLLFVLDVAVDAAFVAHTTKAGRDADVARVFD